MILDKILAQKRREIDALCQQAGPDIWRHQAQTCGRAIRDMRRELVRRELPAVIAEVKKASPSKGVLRVDFHPEAIAEEYETCGAAALSVLTDEQFFQSITGSLGRVKRRVSLPILRKDFIIDAVQVYESRTMGADCILLIAAALDAHTLSFLRREAEALGMQCLVEVHNEAELEMALGCGSRIIGINNRDLQTFSTSLDVTERLIGSVPDDVTVVSESGINSHEDMQRLADLGVDAVLIGESFMRAVSITSQFAFLQGAAAAAGSSESTRRERAKIKICGLQTLDDADAVNRSGADYAGFVFAPSRRQVTPGQAAAISERLADSVRRVGVFVNQPIDLVRDVVRECGLDVVQLHGDEEPLYCQNLRRLTDEDSDDRKSGLEVWKAVAVGAPETERDTQHSLTDYLPYIDGVLMDSWDPQLRGGSGQVFKWERGKIMTHNLAGNVTRILAGGLNETNVVAALRSMNPAVIDVSSGVETDGRKDAEKIQRFVAKVREFHESECRL